MVAKLEFDEVTMGNISDPQPLDARGFVFVGNDGNAYRCCMWGDQPWLFRWQDRAHRWLSVAQLTQAYVLSLPHNLTQSEQDLYFALEADALKAFGVNPEIHYKLKFDEGR